MDCHEIDTGDLVDRYLLGGLSEEEQDLFEEHCFACDQCFGNLRKTEMMMRGLGVLEKEGSLGFGEVEDRPWYTLSRWLSWRPSPALATAMVLVIAILIYPAWRGMVNVTRLDSDLRDARQPQANLNSFSLQQSPRGATQQIPIPEGSGGAFVLHFNIIEKTVSVPKYRAQITDEQGKVVWAGQDLKGTGQYEVFSILCHSSFFKKGQYTLIVFEVDSHTNEVANRIPFEFKVVGK